MKKLDYIVIALLLLFAGFVLFKVLNQTETQTEIPNYTPIPDVKTIQEPIEWCSWNECKG